MAAVRPKNRDVISFGGMSKPMAVLILDSCSSKKDLYRHTDDLVCILTIHSPVLEFMKRKAPEWKLENWPPQSTGGNAILIDRWLADRIVTEAATVWKQT